MSVLLSRRLATVLGMGSPGCLVALICCHLGCSPSSRVPAEGSKTRNVSRTLSVSQAAELAAKLANDECERLHKKRPFAAGQDTAVLEDGRYRWGRLDPGGPSGLSAVVAFNPDGTQPEVRVYFSTDINDPRLERQPPAPRLPRLPELKR